MLVRTYYIMVKRKMNIRMKRIVRVLVSLCTGIIVLEYLVISLIVETSDLLS